MKSLDGGFSAWNAGYVEELHARYLENPRSVDGKTRGYFERRGRHDLPLEKVIGAVRLADSIRKYGHRAARVDPLAEPSGDEALDLEYHSLTEGDLERLPAMIVEGPLSRTASSAREAMAGLRRIYCSTRGYDYGHIHGPEERHWLVETAESERFRPPNDPIDALAILRSLTRVEAFERFLHRTLPGRFRFSIEGLDMLLPLLEEILGEAAENGVRRMILGMAHRGRLNTLVHLLGKAYATVMAELRDPECQSGKLGDEAGFRGDVLYHRGARRAKAKNETIRMVVSVPPNPSHVEAIDPVVVGMARAAGSFVEGAGAPRLDPAATLPVLVHGDASFPGQGVVAETLNLGRLEAYESGGALHIIANNGLGFTTDPEELYSTRYAGDLAKGFDLPVLHVNADDPEAVIEAGRTAVAFLKRFRKDFVIDLVGYRRRGHNESDEPSFTHPLRYRAIEAEPTVREKWADELLERGAIEDGEAGALHRDAMARLGKAWNESRDGTGLDEPQLRRQRPPAALDSRVPLDRLRRLNDSLLELPENFRIHPKLAKAREARKRVLSDPEARTVDWATAEELAFATILAEGIPIRVTGEDVERGTFSQRHAVLHDYEKGEEHVPLQALTEARASFEVANSPLSENAALGFEVGLNLEAPDRLVVWEAQYGDFANGAQVVIDEFLVSARAKWGLEPSLVLLLPHGHEGHGPDHSSARPERFLSLAVGDHLWVANPTTASQYFHLLRSQARAVRSGRAAPLVVFTPKGLLRHPLARSSPRELAEGTFSPVLEEVASELDRERARRLVLCTGKVSVDLADAAGEQGTANAAFCRIEQLHPFPRKELEGILSAHRGLEEVVWVQEEPENMGAWSFVRPRLSDMLPRGAMLRYLGREPSPSPAEGSYSSHKRRQEEIVRLALSPAQPEES